MAQANGTATKQTSPNVKAGHEVARRKLTVSRLDLAKEPAGYSFQGKYVGETLSTPFNDVDKKTGEVVSKTLTFAIFEDDAGNRFKVIQDAGLKQALVDAMVVVGNHIEVVKLAKQTLTKGRTMNQYDIYAL